MPFVQYFIRICHDSTVLIIVAGMVNVKREFLSLSYIFHQEAILYYTITLIYVYHYIKLKFIE